MDIDYISIMQENRESNSNQFILTLFGNTLYPFLYCTGLISNNTVSTKDIK